MRTGLMERSRPETPDVPGGAAWVDRVPFAAAGDVVAAVGVRVPADAVERLRRTALDAIHGRILCFGRWTADFGEPVDWYVNPRSGRRWTDASHWSRAMAGASEIGDVKYTWEAARFPHAYHIARAAAFEPERAPDLARALADRIESFAAAAPFGRGIHWYSSQEIVFRVIAWAFAAKTLLAGTTGCERAVDAVGRAVLECAAHVEHHIAYAVHAVHNNHLLSEALGLLFAAELFPEAAPARRWRETATSILDEQADRQFYEDGAYIQQSHNYHRLALQDMLVAWTLEVRAGRTPPESWRRALARSVDFLVAHQNPDDGWLPNYGFNDGALPLVLSACDFSDFRPTLQAASLAAHGERLYEPGPWDEEAAWLLGPGALDAPLHAPARQSVAFARTGYYVLRGRDSRSFSTFRCGTIRDRFAQIDMLHVDVWWRGLNVLVDGGSYSYNGPEAWHNHFMRTASHNTVEVDGFDQMLHHRRFKCLYWTRASLLRFEESEAYAECAGEHFGYERHDGRCVHRRSVLFVKDDLWIVVDRIAGRGEHAARLHWLCGDFAHDYEPEAGRLTLETPEGPFSIAVYDEHGRPLAGTVERGREEPPRGWLSRYYGERTAVPSLEVEARGALPFVFVTLAGAGQPEIVAGEDGSFVVRGSETEVRFRLRDGIVERAP